jgi:hypothetical protein
MNLPIRKPFQAIYPWFIWALIGCTVQDERYVQVATLDVDIDRLAATIPMHPLVRPPLSEDLSEIEACMLTVLRTTPDVEDARLGTISDNPGGEYPPLEFRYEGHLIRFGVSKLRVEDRDVYTFATDLPGLGPPPWTWWATRIAENLGWRCGAEVVVFF